MTRERRDKPPNVAGDIQAPKRFTVRRTRRGARLLHGRHVLSEILAQPGATGSIFDLLAAAAFAWAPPGPVAMLGFAGGAVIAPLRALGSAAPVHAVDLSLEAAPLFWSLSRKWAGPVHLFEAEASRWLGASRHRFAAVIEDLSAQVPGNVIKPPVSFEALPSLIANRLAPGGLVVVNGLPMPGRRWDAVLGALAGPHRQVSILFHREYENRVLLAARKLAAPRVLHQQLAQALELIGSPLAQGLTVRRFR
jgi:hypothetical protein